MKLPLRIFLGMASIILITAPLSVLFTLLLLPFWSWLETTTGIESVGHSGPAAWCYAAVFLIMVVSALLPLVALLRRVQEGKQAAND
jgi:TRAP-type C4-dicarboxylate transport system permease small subunit